jgi:uncharacterized membrane protein
MRKHLHPANQARHDDLTLGQRVADSVTTGFGSWTFIIWQSVVVSVWIVLNFVAFISHWDPYPFILLNLVFSTQAAYAAPLILLAQNRQEEHDRVRAEHDYVVNEESLTLLRNICSGEVALRIGQTSIAENVSEIVEKLDD